MERGIKNMSKMKQTSELQSPRAFPEVDRQIVFSDLIGHGDIIIHAADIRVGQHGEFMVLLAEDAQGKFTTATDSRSSIELVKFAFEKNERPFAIEVKKRSGMCPYLA